MTIFGRIQTYVIKYSKTIEFDDITFFRALDLAQALEDEYPFFISGKSSSGLAAAVVYLSSIHLIEQRTGRGYFSRDRLVTQRSLMLAGCGETCGVQSVTIADHSKAIRQELGYDLDSWIKEANEFT